MSPMQYWIFSDAVVVWMINVLLQVTIVAAVALLAAYCLRRHAIVRHWILFSALALIVMSPLASGLMPSDFRVASVSLSPPQTHDPVAAPDRTTGGSATAITAASSSRNHDSPTSPWRSPVSESGDTSTAFPVAGPLVPRADQAETSIADADRATDSLPAIPVVAAADPFTAVRITFSIVACIWVCGLIVMLIRLLRSWLSLAAMLRGARPMTCPQLGRVMAEACQSLGVTEPPPLLCSTRASGPMVAGMWKPRMIMPSGMVEQVSRDELRDVVIHEIAHLLRRDQFVVMLQNFAAAIFWIHPLLHMLNRRLACAREELCDNHVLTATDALSYSRTLLRLAECVGHDNLLPASAGLFTYHWKLESRVRGILDQKRNLKTRLTILGTALVLTTSIAMAVVSACGTISLAQSGESRSSTQKATAERVTADDGDQREKLAIHGLVRDTAGSPIPNAKVTISPLFPDQALDRTPQLLGLTDAAGKFQFDVEHDAFYGSSNLLVVVTAAGYGPDWSSVSPSDEPLLFQLPNDDVAIEGSLRDLEGQPVTGATVRIRSIRAMRDGDLAPYIRVVKAGNGSNYRFDKYLFDPPHEPQTTDEQGGFRISGVGSHRLVELVVAGDRIQHSVLRVITEPTEPIRPQPDPGSGSRSIRQIRSTVYGASFSLVAQPSRPIVGTVIDADTGAPIQNAAVGQLNGPTATTDEKGRFELFGSGKASSYRLMAHVEDQPYLSASKRVSDQPGFEPLHVEIKMTRGILITGRVTDGVTGNPIAAAIKHFPLYPNEHLTRGIGGSEANALGAYTEDTTNRNGEFEIAVLPGPGFLGVVARDRDRYQTAHVDAAAFFEKQGVPYGRNMRGMQDSLAVASGGSGMAAMPQSNWQAIELLNLPPDAGEPVRRDLQLRPANQIRGVVVGTDGKPILGVTVYGLDGHRRRTTLVNETFAVAGLGAQETRSIFFRHEARKLAAALKVSAADKPRVQIQLQPWGEVKGRLLDQNGEPLANLLFASIGNGRDGETVANLPEQSTTDDQGRFHVVGLVPGSVYVFRPFDLLKPEIRIVARAGETIDAGDVKGHFESGSAKVPDPGKTTAARAGRQVEASDDLTLVRGIVLDPAGNPVPNAEVRAVHDLTFWSQGMPTIKTNTSSRGEFELSLSKSTFTPKRGGPTFAEHWKTANVIATAPGYGPAWIMFGDINEGQQVNLQLVEDAVIHGRVVDLEGEPLAGVTVKPILLAASRNQDLTPWLTAIAANDDSAQTLLDQQMPVAGAGLPDELKTDADGRFQIKGVGRERRLTVSVEGQNVVRGTVTIVTRRMKPQPWKNGWRFLAPGPVYGAEFQHAIALSRPIVGVVRDSETGEPLEGVSIQSYTMMIGGIPVTGDRSLRTASDEQGRYRLTGMSHGSENRIVVVPSDDDPFFMKVVPVPTVAGIGTIPLDIELERGLFITGRVTEKGTGAPVAGATLHYLPFLTNHHAAALAENGALPATYGIPNRYLTGADGTYRLVGLPGRAIVGVLSSGKPYRLGVGAEAIEGLNEQNEFLTLRGPNRPGLSWPHAMSEINVTDDQDSIELNLQVDVGATMKVTVLDSKGDKLIGYRVDGMSSATSNSRQLSPTFDATNFGPDEVRTIVITHQRRKLSRVIQVSMASGQEHTVQLQPGASIVGRVVDRNADGVGGAYVDARLLVDGFKVLPRVTTDSDGRFRFENVPCGCEYEIRAQVLAPNIAIVELSRVKPRPGETTDLGEHVVGDGDG